MRFNLKIPKNLKLAFDKEFNLYNEAMQKLNFDLAWHHLQRLHIIGQSYPIEHNYSHWLMLKFGLRQKNSKEVFGQIIRLLVGGWKSFINHIPKGNTGGANVPPFRIMELPNDLKFILSETEK